MVNNNRMRGIDIIQKKENKSNYKKIGPSTEKTNLELYKLYMEIKHLRNGKTIDELLNQANDPKLFVKAKKTRPFL